MAVKSTSGIIHEQKEVAVLLFESRCARFMASDTTPTYTQEHISISVCLYDVKLLIYGESGRHLQYESTGIKQDPINSWIFASVLCLRNLSPKPPDVW